MSRADRLHQLIESAHAALDDGDLPAVRAALANAQRIDRKHPVVRDLEGNLAMMEGDDERAIEIFTALADEDDNPAHRINVANLLFYSQGDAAGALAALERAWPDIDDEDDLIAAILLKADAHLALGGLTHLQAARAVLDELDSSPMDDDPGLAIQLAEARIACDQPDRAQVLAQALTKHPDGAPDGYYLLGHIADYKHDEAARTKAWLEVRTLDLAEPRPPWALDHAEVDRIASETLAELPPRARELLGPVPILVDAYPTVDQIESGVDPRLLGLFSGTPMTEASAVGGTPHLTAIHLFLHNLEQTTQDADHLAEQIRVTILHETAHFFGLDEDQVEALGLG